MQKVTWQLEQADVLLLHTQGNVRQTVTHTEPQFICYAA